MGYRYRRRRRRIKITVSLIAVLLCSVFLVSCMASANVTWVRALLGYDVTDYSGESSVAELDRTDVRCAELCEMVKILSAEKGIHLDPFSNTADAVALYRDAILGDMLRDNYSLYTGNREELDRVAGIYPQMQVSTLIPVNDFENTVFRYFGGTRVKNENGTLYSYLNRASCYTAPIQVMPSQAEIEVESLVETQNTYRMRFTLTDGEEQSGVYTAIFLKREDGSCYFRALEA